MPTPAIICQECGSHRPIYMDDPSITDHISHLTYQTEVWHGFEMWNNPAQMYCADDERLDPSWRSKRCTCPQQIRFGRDEMPKRKCRLHGRPWQGKYFTWLSFQPFEKDMESTP